MYYVYLAQSQKDHTYYSGVTTDLKRRISEHNRANVSFTASKLPLKLVWYGAFLDKATAYRFEKYLKSSSGFAFRNKHLI